MQSPDRRRIDPEMNVRCAGTLTDREIFVNVRERVRIRRCRCWGHYAPPVLCRTTPHVNSKAFLFGAAASRVAAKLLFEKINDHRFDQAGDNSRYAQEKSRL